MRASIVAAVVLWSVAAHADDKSIARQAYIDGSRYYDLNQFPEALEAFKRAYFNFEDPVILFNIAQCHRALGHKKDAIDFYRSYLRKAATAGNRDDVQRMISELSSALDKEKVLATAPPQGTMPSENRPVHSPMVAPVPAPVVVVSPPAPVSPARAPVVVARPVAPPHRDRPLWKRAWLWGVVGGVVIAGVAVGVGVGLGTRAHPPQADGAVGF